MAVKAPQTWVDKSAANPLSAARMTVIEERITETGEPANATKATKPVAGAAGEVKVGTAGVCRQVNAVITQKAATLAYTIKHNLGTVVIDVTPLKELAGPKYEVNTIEKIVALNENEVEVKFASVVESAVWWFSIHG